MKTALKDYTKRVRAMCDLLVRGLNLRQSKSASVANAAAQTLRHLEPIFILRCGSLRAMSYS